MSKKNKVMIGIFLLILLVAPFASHYMATNSEPFHYSTKAIEESVAVKESVGNVTSVQLAPFGYSVRYVGSQGWADFEIEVAGIKGSGILFVKLERDLGTWQIIGARLNGKEIKL